MSDHLGTLCIKRLKTTTGLCRLSVCVLNLQLFWSYTNACSVLFCYFDQIKTVLNGSVNKYILQFKKYKLCHQTCISWKILNSLLYTVFSGTYSKSLDGMSLILTLTWKWAYPIGRFWKFCLDLKNYIKVINGFFQIVAESVRYSNYIQNVLVSLDGCLKS